MTVVCMERRSTPVKPLCSSRKTISQFEVQVNGAEKNSLTSRVCVRQQSDWCVKLTKRDNTYTVSRDSAVVHKMSDINIPGHLPPNPTYTLALTTSPNRNPNCRCPTVQDDIFCMDHAACEMCGKGPHIRTACERCGLMIICWLQAVRIV